MTVAPTELQGIIAHKLHVYAFQAGRDASSDDFPFAGKFFDTAGARAILPQIP
jgi:hypothetical protein